MIKSAILGSIKKKPFDCLKIELRDYVHFYFIKDHGIIERSSYAVGYTCLNYERKWRLLFKIRDL